MANKWVRFTFWDEDVASYECGIPTTNCVNCMFPSNCKAGACAEGMLFSARDIEGLLRFSDVHYVGLYSDGFSAGTCNKSDMNYFTETSGYGNYNSRELCTCNCCLKSR